MKIVSRKIRLSELEKMAQKSFGDMVKAVVDVEKEVMAVGGGLHADEESLLLEDGSRQKDLWGINIYPGLKGKNFIEFDSMINMRPLDGNRSRGIDSRLTRKEIAEILDKLIEK